MKPRVDGKMGEKLRKKLFGHNIYLPQQQQQSVAV